MITEDYVSYEVAKLLKDKGFPQTRILGDFITNMIYKVKTNESGKHSLLLQYPDRRYNKDRYIAAPTYQMAMKWLRKKHNLSIDVCTIQGREVSYMFNIWDFSSIHDNKFIGGTFDLREQLYDFKAPEEAAETAIKYCLENLI